MQYKESVIYIIKSKTKNRIYVGSAIDFYNRKKKHLSDLMIGRHHSKKLQYHVNKYSINDIEFEIIEYVLDKSKLIEKEQYYIDKFEPYFNCCKIAGSCFAIKQSDKTKLKRKKTNIKNKEILDKINSKLTYKKLIGFTQTQKLAFERLEKYDVNVSQFIRQAIKEKLKRDWKEIKDKKEKIKLPF
jgi:group I intron endonuclease